MRKTTIFPIPVNRELKKLGSDMKDARIRRRISATMMCQRAGITRPTLQKVEKGDPMTSMGIYAKVLFVLNLHEKLGDMAYDHEMKSKANDLDYVLAHYDELMEEAHKVANIVNEYLGAAAPVFIAAKEEKEIEVDKAKKTILVVDDSNVISSYLSNLFNEKYNIVLAKDGSEAIEKMSDKSLNVKIMLLDLNMPTVNGYDVLNFMKVNSINDINVAIVTSTDSTDVLENIKGYRVGVLVEKPFNEESIKSAVERLDQQ